MMTDEERRQLNERMDGHCRRATEVQDVCNLSAVPVGKALAVLEPGEASEAIRILKNLCSQIPDLPPFEIV